MVAPTGGFHPGRSRGRALVVGAGIAGLTSAYWIHRAGYDVDVVESEEWPRERGFMIDFYGFGYRVAEEMGIIGELRDLVPPASRWTFKDRSGEPLFTLPYDAVRAQIFAGRHVGCLKSDLERALLARVCIDADVRCGLTLVGVRHAGPRLSATLSDGTSNTYDLIVGAGGAHSAVRRLWFDVDAQLERYAGVDVAGVEIGDAALHEAVGTEVRLLSGPGRHVTISATDDGGISATFATARPSPFADHRTSAIVAELRRVYDDFGGLVPALLARLDSSRTITYEPVMRVGLASWSAGRAVLVGDACLGVAAVGTQGASLAMAGGWALGQELLRAGDDTRVALALYERRMRPMAARALAAGNRVAAWLAPTSKARMIARDLAVRASVWPVASMVVRHALATAGRRL